jgi:DNA-binding transcriptional LysR family regulator
LASVELEIGAFASPKYAKTLPRKYSARDVAWIAWAPPLDHVTPNPELKKMVPNFSPAFASDDYLVQLRAADVGLGAIVLGRLSHRFSASARLVELDLDFGDHTSTLHCVAAKGALDIPRVRAMADLLALELSQMVANKKRR